MSPATTNPPRPPDDSGDLSDGREIGEWRSRYKRAAWVHILIELTYLLVLLVVIGVTLISIGKAMINAEFASSGWLSCCFTLPLEQPILIWVVAALSGVCGGATFSLKYLYHSIAKGQWSCDRTIWRFVVPIVSGVVAVFFTFLVISGIIPLLNVSSVNSIFAALGLGFVAGFFSDNVIAALYNVADNLFGTTKEPKPSNGHALRQARRDNPASDADH